MCVGVGEYIIADSASVRIALRAQMLWFWFWFFAFDFEFGFSPLFFPL
jgi:hypothetical protein